MIEIREQGVWRPVEGYPARIVETEPILMRGFAPGASVRIGPVEAHSEPDGCVRIRLSEDERLDCHLGVLPVESSHCKGEIEILPGKMTQEAYARLRGELETAWAGLILDQGSATSLRAKGPDARELWRRVGPAIDSIRKAPPQRLGSEIGYRRLEHVRRAGELTPAVMVAGQRGLPARTRVLCAVPATEEIAYVADTMRRLMALASRQGDGQTIVEEVQKWLREPPLDLEPRSAPIHSSHAIRHDRRLRMVQQVRRALDHPGAVITEGPGELRLGIKALNRLYEYWVYLTILKLASERLGRPEGAGFSSLAHRLPGSRLRLELPAGTTVQFPGGWSIGFEPRISQDPRLSWCGLECVPHPDPTYRRTHLTPDVCVVCLAGPPRLWVIDAKYRPWYSMDEALTETHACYGRIRMQGSGVVEEVIVAHPHRSLVLRWAGQRGVAFCPGSEPPLLAWLSREGRHGS